MTKAQNTVLKLIHSAVNGSVCDIGSSVHWQEVIDVASRQGVLGVCFDAIELLPSNQRPDMYNLMVLLGQVSCQEKKYEHSWEVACELSDLFASVGVKATVLKGRSIAQYYPKPNHRYSCDLDIYVPSNGTDSGDWEKVFKLLEAKGIDLVYEVYKEVEFFLRWCVCGVP